MSEKKKKKAGRPVKATFEVKRSIIDAFFIAEGGEDASIFHKHGIFRRLAEFSSSKELGLEARDFSRDQKVLDYLGEIAASAPIGETPLAYEPLDITGLLSKNLKQQIDILRQRDQYYENIYLRGNKAIMSYTNLSRQRDLAVAQLNESHACVEAIKKEIEEVRAELRESQQEAIKLRAYIRDHVEPEMADKYLKGLAAMGREQVPNIAATVVTSDLANMPNTSNNSIVGAFLSFRGTHIPINLNEPEDDIEDNAEE